jgi:hypothetical protein
VKQRTEATCVRCHVASLLAEPAVGVTDQRHVHARGNCRSRHLIDFLTSTRESYRAAVYLCRQRDPAVYLCRRRDPAGIKHATNFQPVAVTKFLAPFKITKARLLPNLAIPAKEDIYIPPCTVPPRGSLYDYSETAKPHATLRFGFTICLCTLSSF